MANKGRQLDKLSIKHFILHKSDRKTAKKEHTRKVRREAKKIDNPDPKWNRYGGWIA